MKLSYIESIGKGAFADVWLATDDELGRQVAVKFFRDTDPDVHRQVALNHARALARVQHPRIVTIFGIEPQKHPSSEKDCIAIVMEHVKGTSLSLHREQLSADQARTLLSDMADALDAIHTAGLIHYDFHEGNVMVTPMGAKVLDILYTRSLAEVGARTAQGDRQHDIRDYANVARFVLERTNSIDTTKIYDAHFRACHATTAIEACEAFSHILTPRPSIQGTSDTITAHENARLQKHSYDESDLYLLWTPDNAPYPATHVYARCAGTLTHIGTLKQAYHATATHLWTIRTQSRPVRILKDEVIDRWHQSQWTYSPTSSDYKAHTINDAHVIRIGDLVSIPLSGSEPAPLTDTDYFEYQRALHVLGALGPYIFIEEHDYTFGGGAHGGVSCCYRIIDLDNMRAIGTVEDLFDATELTNLRRHDVLAQQAFLAFRAAEIASLEEPKATLVSARPYLNFGAEVMFGLMLKYCTSSCYAASDHRWSSYSVSEELPLRESPQLLAQYTKMPADLVTALNGRAARAVGWSRVAPDHPQRNEFTKALEMSANLTNNGSK